MTDQLSPPQLRAARALLGLSAEQVAMRTGLGVATIRRAEREGGTTLLSSMSRERLLAFFAECSVALLPETSSAGVGVRMTKAR